MPESPPPGIDFPEGGPNLPEKCPSCHGPLSRGYLGTNGRVFWSHEKHFLGVAGDEVLIPVALVRTSYRLAARCQTCSLVAFLYGDAGDPADVEAAEAIIGDAMSGPDPPP